MPNQLKPPTPEKKVDGKVVALAPEKKSDKGKDKMAINLINHNQIERSLNKGLMCYWARDRDADLKTH